MVKDSHLHSRYGPFFMDYMDAVRDALEEADAAQEDPRYDNNAALRRITIDYDGAVKPFELN